MIELVRWRGGKEKQITKERKAFLECQAAWEKYYQLDQPTNQLLVNSTAISQKLNNWGLRISPRLVYAASYLVQQQWPEFRLEKESIFSREQQKYLVYHYEVLPKCQKLKDWEKQMNYLAHR